MVSPLEVLGQLKFQWQWIASQAVAFLLLYLLMRKFAFAPIQQILREREERVRKAIEDAERQRAEMERLRSEYEQRLARIEEEARARLQEAMQQAYQARDACWQKRGRRRSGWCSGRRSKSLWSGRN
jgi:F-type H+-transporting ATPase subunit b